MAVEQASSSNDRTHLRILIVGCGIGALACAVAFRKAGHETTIWEKAPVVQEVISQHRSNDRQSDYVPRSRRADTS